jgi:hypothetical protein
MHMRAQDVGRLGEIESLFSPFPITSGLPFLSLSLPLSLVRTDNAYTHRWLQDLRFSFRRLRREGYVAQESASQDGLSDWLLGTSESLKRPTPVSGLELECAIVHVHLLTLNVPVVPVSP